ATLLAHELAHLRRRDQWVRILELLTTGLYWWLPILWWARRELEEAEEQCCDAWVLWALPGSGRTYALGLVETVDFLSGVRPARPLLASGFGQVQSLKRRITMIMSGTTSRSLTWTGLLAVLGLGVALLPLVPTWAQTRGGGDNPEQGIVQGTEAERAEAEKALKHQRRLAEEQRDRATIAMMEARRAQERAQAQDRELRQRQLEQEVARLRDETELLQLQVAGKEAEL